MRELDVLGVRVEMPTNQPIVLLREKEGGRYLPIWIGAAEAAAITYAQQGVVPPRPLTHDLLRDVIAGLGHELTEVRIVALRDSVFHAALIIDGTTEIGSRASDAIALAVRTGAKVLVDPGVLDEAAIVVSSDEDDEVERFKEFLDQVSAEDFEAVEEPPGEGPEGTSGVGEGGDGGDEGGGPTEPRGGPPRPA
ncbi:MAG TPA: bifunctional nuclease family protein [Intrasporangium sp.]|uniref:bifunctional nuclease family protein n=1 Tax=Intrasporangium sp. TaxID=1925024 RepID=UPI002D78CCE2|nr:bifunctional nuclease family protein [Intrasporangium sp.]HET7397698.1 bifunctional nuclease family protein [Intrasporangium sp.]